MPQGGSTGDWNATGTADATPDSERLRQELRDAPRELVDWEASCLKNIADLLDSLDRARVRWETLGEELKETQDRLDRAQEERDLLAESHSDAQKAREELRSVRRELEEIRRERDDVAANLVAAREHLEQHLEAGKSAAASRHDEHETARQENEHLRAELVELRRKEEDAADTERNLRHTMGQRDQELADVKGRLIEADLALEDEREKMVEVRQQAEDATARAEQLADSAERVEEAERVAQKSADKLRRVETEHEDNLVLLFDLRTRAERLEEKLDDADDKTRKKVRRIIAKVHAELDAAGAPADADTSYGERIRQLGDLLRDI